MSKSIAARGHEAHAVAARLVVHQDQHEADDEAVTTQQASIRHLAACVQAERARRAHMRAKVAEMEDAQAAWDSAVKRNVRGKRRSKLQLNRNDARRAHALAVQRHTEALDELHSALQPLANAGKTWDAVAAECTLLAAADEQIELRPV